MKNVEDINSKKDIIKALSGISDYLNGKTIDDDTREFTQQGMYAFCTKIKEHYGDKDYEELKNTMNVICPDYVDMWMDIIKTYEKVLAEEDEDVEEES